MNFGKQQEQQIQLSFDDILLQEFITFLEKPQEETVPQNLNFETYLSSFINPIDFQFMPPININTMVINPNPTTPIENLNHKFTDSTATVVNEAASHSKTNNSKKRRRTAKKTSFMEEVVSKMEKNSENPNFCPRKCTKYAPKSTPYDHLKHEFTLE